MTTTIGMVKVANITVTREAVDYMNKLVDEAKKSGIKAEDAALGFGLAYLSMVNGLEAGFAVLTALDEVARQLALFERAKPPNPSSN